MPPSQSATQSVTITMSRCTGCGAIEGPSARSHTCVPGRDEWGQRSWSLDKNSLTELVTFALLEGSARPHDD
jgi:hypothetical protein